MLQHRSRSPQSLDPISGQIQSLEARDTEQGTQVAERVIVQVQGAKIRALEAEVIGQRVQARGGEFEHLEVEEGGGGGEDGEDVVREVQVGEVVAGLVIDFDAFGEGLGTPREGVEVLEGGEGRDVRDGIVVQVENAEIGCIEEDDGCEAVGGESEGFEFRKRRGQ